MRLPHINCSTVKKVTKFLFQLQKEAKIWKRGKKEKISRKRGRNLFAGKKNIHRMNHFCKVYGNFQFCSQNNKNYLFSSDIGEFCDYVRLYSRKELLYNYCDDNKRLRIAEKYCSNNEMNISTCRDKVLL